MRSLPLACLALALSTGCALTTAHIRIDYPTPGQVEHVRGAENIHVKVEVRDLCPAPSREVSRKINALGMRMAPIVNEEDIEALLRRSIETELAARGYRLADGRIPVLIELTGVAHQYATGFWAGDSEATVTFTAKVKDLHGRELYAVIFSDSFKDRVQVFGGGNVKQAYERALPGAIHKLMSMPDFHEAIARAASALPPSPEVPGVQPPAD